MLKNKKQSCEKMYVEYVYIAEIRRSFQIHVVKAAINKDEFKVNKSASENIFNSLTTLITFL